MKNAVRLTGIALVLVMGSACSGARTERPVVTRADGDSTTSPSGTQVASQGKSLVRLVNALSSKQRISVSGDDLAVFVDVGYKAVTGYHELTDNLITFRLRLPAADSVLSENRETLTDGSRYTIVALPGKHGAPSMRILRDEVVPAEGQAKLRVINAAPDIGSIDVAQVGQKETIFSAVRYADEAGYKDITPGTVTLDIRSDLKTMKPVQLKDRQFEAGRAYTIVLTGWGTRGIDVIDFDDTETGGRLALGKGRPRLIPSN